MPITKKIKTSEIETFRLKFDHVDFIKMMNDTDVRINEENCGLISAVSYSPVPSDQELTVVVNKRGGSEVSMPFTMKMTDKLIIKYQRKNFHECEGRIGNVDLINDCDVISLTPISYTSHTNISETF